MKIIKVIVLIAVLLVTALFAYDLYMRNSGIENRLNYERQKFEVRQQNFEPIDQVLDEQRNIEREIRQETRQDRRQQRKAERREKIKKFFNGGN